MRRFVTLIGILLFAMILLLGCGNGDGTDDPTPPEENQAPVLSVSRGPGYAMGPHGTSGLNIYASDDNDSWEELLFRIKWDTGDSWSDWTEGMYLNTGYRYPDCDIKITTVQVMDTGGLIDSASLEHQASYNCP